MQKSSFTGYLRHFKEPPVSANAHYSFVWLTPQLYNFKHSPVKESCSFKKFTGSKCSSRTGWSSVSSNAPSSKYVSPQKPLDVMVITWLFDVRTAPPDSSKPRGWYGKTDGENLIIDLSRFAVDVVNWSLQSKTNVKGMKLQQLFPCCRYDRENVGSFKLMKSCWMFLQT